MEKDVLAIKGTAFHSTAPDAYEILQDCLLFVNESGVISKVILPGDENYNREEARAGTIPDFIELKEGQYLLPGFIDTHVHAPQWAQVGKALDVDLPTWLNNYTFPLESSYRDPIFAEKVYRNLVKTLLLNGTTTVQYFGTVDYNANVILAQLCADYGQRAFIGKVVMDDPQECPDFYRDPSAKAGVELTEKFLLEMKKLSSKTRQGIHGVVTPRFIPTCTDEVLYDLAALAKQYDAPIQGHCSEGDWEHNFVFNRTGKRDTEALLEYGLLTNKTVMAHCIFLDDNDAKIFAETGAAIAHCPISNVLFGNAVAPIERRLQQGVTVSLATDISAGYTPSMFDNMRQAILSSRTLEEGVDYRLPPEKRGVPGTRIDFRHAFYTATVGGANALNLPTGQFKEGLAFDALLFDCYAPYSNITEYDNDTLADMLQKIIFLGQRQNLAQIWVQGREIRLPQ